MSTAIANRDAMGSMREYLVKNQTSLAAVLPKHMTPEKMTKMALVAASRNPLLLQCSPASVLQCLMTSSSLGLEPNTPLGQAYLIPFKNNRTGVYEAQFIPGYLGLIDLVMRSDKVSFVDADVVRKADKFIYRKGDDPKLTHEPNLDDQDSPVIGAYAVAFINGSTRPKTDFMTKAEIEKIRNKSPGRNSDAWVNHWNEMAKKTVLRRITKTLPKSIELAKALDLEEANARGEKFIDLDVAPIEDIGIEGDQTQFKASEPPASKSDSLADRLGE